MPYHRKYPDVELQRDPKYRGTRTVCWLIKVCTKCGGEFPRAKFRDRPDGYDGKHSACTPCRHAAIDKTNRLEKDRLRRAAGGLEVAAANALRIKKYRAIHGRPERNLERERSQRQLKIARNAGFSSWKDYQADKCRRIIDTPTLYTELYSEEAARKCWRYWTSKLAPPWWKRAYRAAQTYHKYHTDTEHRVGELMRRRNRKNQASDTLSAALRAALRGDRSSLPKGFNLYSAAEFINDFVSKFTPDMTWEAFTRGEIHIDHIIPMKLFNLTKQDEFLRCWALTNLQPLWAEDNLKKSAKLPWDDGYHL